MYNDVSYTIKNRGNYTTVKCFKNDAKLRENCCMQ